MRAIALLSLLVLAACNQTTAPDIAAGETPQTLMVRVAKAAQACWFARKDPAFRPYKMATELDSYSGQPRILIVPRNRPQGLPKLVAQAQRGSGGPRFSAFGPLLQSKDGPRLSAQLNRWAAGSSTC